MPPLAPLWERAGARGNIVNELLNTDRNDKGRERWEWQKETVECSTNERTQTKTETAISWAGLID